MTPDPTPTATPHADTVGEIHTRADYLDALARFVGGRTGDALANSATDLRRYAHAIHTGRVTP